MTSGRLRTCFEFSAGNRWVGVGIVQSQGFDAALEFRPSGVIGWRLLDERFRDGGDDSGRNFRPRHNGEEFPQAVGMPAGAGQCPGIFQPHGAGVGILFEQSLEGVEFSSPIAELIAALREQRVDLAVQRGSADRDGPQAIELLGGFDVAPAGIRSRASTYCTRGWTFSGGLLHLAVRGELPRAGRFDRLEPVCRPTASRYRCRWD